MLHVFSQSDWINFNEVESNAIYYGVMATATKHGIRLDSSKGITIDNFLSLVDHLSCSANTYVSLGGFNGCADQLTNWDGTQKKWTWGCAEVEKWKWGAKIVCC